MANKILSVFCAISLIFCLGGCGENKADSAEKAEPYGIHHAVITVENYGEIKVELDGDSAPITVENFVTLAKSGFYDGLTFHRSYEGFVLQGGDPEGTGRGGSKDKIKGEFKANGYDNPISHSRGVLSMARLGNDNNSASSQFFIVLDDSAKSSLDGLYASFGKVTEGMEIVDKIVKDTPVEDSNGTVKAENQPKIKSIVITD